MGHWAQSRVGGGQWMRVWVNDAQEAEDERRQNEWAEEMGRLMERYTKGDSLILEKKSRKVVAVQRYGEDDAVLFRCPCDERSVYITSPPHQITFDPKGVMTLDGSCGYSANDEHPQNWCHFFIKGGVPEMCGDTQCPGGRL